MSTSNLRLNWERTFQSQVTLRSNPEKIQWWNDSDSDRISRGRKGNTQTCTANSLSYRMLSGQSSPKESPTKDWNVDISAESTAKGSLLIVGVPVTYERKHLGNLPYKHHVTDLIIKQYHDSQSGSHGPRKCFSSLRKIFWIVERRSAVRSVMRRCVDCQRQMNERRSNRNSYLFMASLPKG